MSKPACLGLVVAWRGHEPYLLETLSDPQEIELVAQVIEQSEPGDTSDPILALQERRQRVATEHELFSNFVESLVTDPSSRISVRAKGAEWFKSALRLEHYHQIEKETAKVIAEFALELYEANPEQLQFTLRGKKAEVEVQIFEHPQAPRPAKTAA